MSVRLRACHRCGGALIRECYMGNEADWVCLQCGAVAPPPSARQAAALAEPVAPGPRHRGLVIRSTPPAARRARPIAHSA